MTRTLSQSRISVSPERCSSRGALLPPLDEAALRQRDRPCPSSMWSCSLPRRPGVSQLEESPRQRRDLNAPDAYPPVAAYTQAIEVSGAARTLYISGQVGQMIDGTISDDIVEQSRLAWQNLEAQLKAAGMTLDNLVKITTILPDHGDLAAAREGRRKILG